MNAHPITLKKVASLLRAHHTPNERKHWELKVFDDMQKARYVIIVWRHVYVRGTSGATRTEVHLSYIRYKDVHKVIPKKFRPHFEAAVVVQQTASNMLTNLLRLIVVSDA